MITATQLTEHQDYIYNVAYRFTQDPIDAEDLKQDVILDLAGEPRPVSRHSQDYHLLIFCHQTPILLYETPTHQQPNRRHPLRRFARIHTHHHQRPRIHSRSR